MKFLEKENCIPKKIVPKTHSSYTFYVKHIDGERMFA
jgi:hypothetical protein